MRGPADRDDSERKIQVSEAKLRSILHTAPDTILTVSRDGNILFINRTRTPNSIEQVIGKSCYEFVPIESRARVAQAIEHVFTTRDFDEYEVIGPSDAEGDRGWFSVRVGPLIENDQVVAVTMCAVEVTAYKNEVARTQELLERLHKIASLVPGMVISVQAACRRQRLFSVCE